MSFFYLHTILVYKYIDGEDQLGYAITNHIQYEEIVTILIRILLILKNQRFCTWRKLFQNSKKLIIILK